MTLAELGWSSEIFDAVDSDETNLARIIAVHRSHLKAMTVSGEINIHHSMGSTEKPSIGDWIRIEPPFIDEQGSPAALVSELIPRKSKVSRMSAGDQQQEQIMAANVDTAFVVTSMNQDFDFERLKRYLQVIEEGGARPVVVLSKTDLHPQISEFLEDLKAKIDGDVIILPTSTLDSIGLDSLKDLMPKGTTSVFIGSSGVGKSSLVNALLGESTQTVKAIRESDGQGRHTTTSRNLFFIPSGGMIIDTPGIRDVNPVKNENEVSEQFLDLEEIFADCKYSNCQHTTEPGCAILLALKEQRLYPKTWEAYKEASQKKAHTSSRKKGRRSGQKKNRLIKNK